MKHILIIHPEGNINNNPNLTGIVELLCVKGFSVHIFSVKRTDIYQGSPCEGAALNLFEHPTGSLTDGFVALAGREPSSFIPVVRQIDHEFGHYDLVIGVDRGIIEASVIARILRVPHALISYELFFNEETGPEFKKPEREACEGLAFAVAQDRVRAQCLSDENEIPGDKIIHIPVAGRFVKPGPKQYYLHDLLGIHRQRKIAILMGSVTAWSMPELIVRSAATWSEEWALVLHNRYGLDPETLSFYRKYRDNKNIFFSNTPVENVNDLYKLLHSCDIGFALYAPQPGIWTGNNLRYIGMASGKTSTYLQHGIPVIVNEIGEISRCVREHGLGEVADVSRPISLSFTDSELAQWKKNSLRFFAQNLDLNRTIAPFLLAISDLPERSLGKIDSTLNRQYREFEKSGAILFLPLTLPRPMSLELPEDRLGAMLPKISIVTPSLNQGPYLEECIESVLNQGYPHLEYIVMDGGSTDQSVGIIKKYEKHLSSWSSGLDGGHYRAVNAGFQRSSGDIMGWINSDDKLLPGSLFRIAHIFSQLPHAEWITGRPAILDQAGNIKKIGDIPVWSQKRFLSGDYQWIQQESTFWKRSLWNKAGCIDTNFSLAGDLELWLRFFRHAQLVGIDCLLGAFRSQPSQRSQIFQTKYLEEADAAILKEQKLHLKAGRTVLLPGSDPFAIQVEVFDSWMREADPSFRGVLEELQLSLKEIKLVYDSNQQGVNRKSLEYFLANASQMGKVELLNAVSIAYFLEGRISEAGSIFHSLLELSPNHLRTLNNLAVLYYESCEYQKSRQMIEQIQSVQTDDVELINNVRALLSSLDKMSSCNAQQQDTAEKPACSAPSVTQKGGREARTPIREKQVDESIISTISAPAHLFLSVVITTYNRPEMFERCLRGFEKQTLDFSNFEIIVIDDGSDTDNQEVTRNCRRDLNIRYIYQNNAGLAAARNAGIAVAKGSVIAPFDDDNYPHPDCLARHYEFHSRHPSTEDAMLAFMEWAPGVEITPLMHFVTEVEPLLWWYKNFEHGRMLPFGSLWGGCSSYKKELLQKAGGFNPEFRFGYEDTEAEFRMRQHGLRVQFDRQAINYVLRPVQFEEFCKRSYKQGQSLWKLHRLYPESSQIREYTHIGEPGQAIAKCEPIMGDVNRLVQEMLPFVRSVPQHGSKPEERRLDQLFQCFFIAFEYWKNRGILDAMEGQESRPADRSKSILIVAPELPAYDRASGSFRLFQIIKLLRQSGHRVTFISRSPGAWANPALYVTKLENLGVRVFPADPVKIFEKWGTKLDIPDINLHRILHEGSFDVAYLYFYHLADQYIDEIRTQSPGTHIVIDSVDLHFLREERGAALCAPEMLDLVKETKRNELGVYRRADEVIVVTETDKKVLIREVPGLSVEVVPNIHPIPLEKSPSLHSRQDFLFIGSFLHHPNFDAIQFFCSEVWPLISSKLPQARLYIVGDSPHSEVRALANDRIIVTGYVPDLAPYLKKCRVSIAPLRYGAGMKGKVGEAMAAGLPVVATSIAAEGMNLETGRHVLVANEASEFADAAIRLHQDEELWNRLSQNGKAHIETFYSPETIRKKLEDILSTTPAVANAPVVNDSPNTAFRGLGYGADSESNFGNQPGRRPRFSVITPSFNQASYIEQNIRSVLNQQYPEFEHIVIDGGSTDDTVSVLKRFPHLKWISEKDNGQSDALNKGFAKASGDIICWLNSDDWLAPGAFERIAQQLSSKGKAAVMGKCVLTDAEGLPFSEVVNRERTFYHLLKYWIPYSIPCQPAIFFLRSLLESVKREDGTYVDSALHYTMDQDLWARMMKKTHFHHIDQTLVYYRFHDQSKTVAHDNLFVKDWSCVFNRYARKDVSAVGIFAGSNPRELNAFISGLRKTLPYSFHELGELSYESLSRETSEWILFAGEPVGAVPPEAYEEAIKLLAQIESIGSVKIGSSLSVTQSPSNHEEILPGAKSPSFLFRRFALEELAAEGKCGAKPADIVAALYKRDWKTVEFRHPARLVIGHTKCAPLVSVIIPCYNHAEYLRKCVESVLHQSLQSFEIIIVNDGSTDDSRSVAESLIEEFSTRSIRLIDQPNSGTPAVARDNGISQAIGKYLLCLDADDMIHPEMLQRTAQLLEERPEISIAYTDVQMFGAESHIWNTGPWDVNTLRYQNILPYCSLYRREVWEAVGGYNPDHDYEDWDFWISCAEKGFCAEKINKTLFLYHVKASSRYTSAREHDLELKAQIIINHPNLYDSSTLRAAENALRHSISTGGDLISSLDKMRGCNAQQQDTDGKHASSAPCVTRKLDQEDRTHVTVNSRRPLISAIVSTYNSERFIRGCLEDLVRQTIAEQMEIIVLDSGSKEDERAVIKEFQSRFNNIVSIRTEEREPLYAAWNRGILMSHGVYLTNANTDDRHRGDALELLTSVLETYPSEGLVYADCLVTSAENETFEQTTALRRYDLPDYNLGTALSTSMFGPQPVWRREVHDRTGFFDTSFSIAGDCEFFTRVAHQFGAIHLRETLGLFLQSEGSLSGRHNSTKTIQEIFRALTTLRTRIRLEDIYPALNSCLDDREALGWARYDFANLCAMSPYPDFKMALEYYQSAIEDLGNREEILNNLGILLFCMGEADRARDFLSRIHCNGLSHINLSHFYAIEQNGPPQMPIQFEFSCSDHPVVQRAHLGRAAWLHQQGDLVHGLRPQAFWDVYVGPNAIPVSEREKAYAVERKPRLDAMPKPGNGMKAASGHLASARACSERFGETGSPLNILMTMYGWKDDGGGTLLPRQMAIGLAGKGHKVTVIYAAAQMLPDKTPYHVEESWDEGVRLFGVFNRGALFYDLENPEREMHDKMMCRVLTQIASVCSPDIIHYHGLFNFSMMAAMEPALHRIPSVYTSHNYWLICPRLYLIRQHDPLPCSGPSMEGHKCAECIGMLDKQSVYASRAELGREIMRQRISRHLVGSSRVRSILIENGHDPSNIHVFHQYPASVDNIRKTSGGLPTAVRALERPLRVGFFGSVLPSKGVHFLAHALQAFQPGSIECHVHGQVYEGIERYMTTLEQIDSKKLLRFHGAYDQAKLPHLLAGVDVVVVPSMWDEIGPLVVVEALAARVPVIGSCIGGIPDFICDGENGFLFELGDAQRLSLLLHRFLINPQLLDFIKGRIVPPKDFDTYLDELVVHYRKTQVQEKPQVEGQPKIEADSHGEKSCQRSPANGQSRQEISLTWEGSQFVNHSLALINRELCHQLPVLGQEVSIIPFEPDEFTYSADPRFRSLKARFYQPLSGKTAVHVRHQWPPNFTPPQQGHWVMIQPWEYGRLPESWIEPMANLVDEIWVPSRHVLKTFIASGIPADRVQVVPNGVNIDQFHPNAQKRSLESSKKFRFLFVGGTLWRKGIDILLDAYRDEFDAHDDVVLVIKDMGQRTYYIDQGAETIINEIRKDPQAPEIVYFNTALEPLELPGLYTACDCLVHPYRGEGFGLPVLEAMACGIPVITTAGGSTDDFCPPDDAYLIPSKRTEFTPWDGTKLVGGEGVVLEPDANALKALMREVFENYREAKDRALRASEHVRRHYSWQTIAEKVLARIHQLAQQPVRREGKL